MSAAWILFATIGPAVLSALRTIIKAWTVRRSQHLTIQFKGEDEINLAEDGPAAIERWMDALAWISGVPDRPVVAADSD